jgi:hypothetical protein
MVFIFHELNYYLQASSLDPKFQLTYERKHIIGQCFYLNVDFSPCIQNGRPYVIKVIPMSRVKNSRDLTKLQKEIYSIALLHHENIIQLPDFF